MLRLYRFIAQFLTPLLKAHLKRRLKQGKEDPTRLYERFGGASLPRPQGKLLWIHAASVGESVSVLQLIKDLRHKHPDISILLTTGTVTSARLMAQRLPPEVIHHYIPLDVPQWINRFLNHWQPNEVIFLESELWPNILQAVKKRSIPLMLLNASLSEKSYRRWRLARSVATEIFSYFDRILTPSLDTAIRLKGLSVETVELTTNLKFTATSLPVNQEELARLQRQITRPLFAAVSTHSGEEEKIIQAYLILKQKYPELLLILAPRHPSRAEEILKMLEETGLATARRSLEEIPTPKHHVWLIDTIGDLGLIYSLAPFCFLGGSLVPIGGHNAIEPFALNCLVIQGNQTFKSNHINLILAPVLVTVNTAEDLVAAVDTYLQHPEKFLPLQQQAQAILTEQRQGFHEIIDKIMESMQ
ncbi:3-deoxy-D-manno-octulosonic acid transferase [Candidatus Odyssella acanthamoebae]|uniref:3-deoxy-D-manno-octulosonic acid transferase n=1 Tax=Candidatus Odyssella acanthamoebae TaxID=91604 RepID=UPI00068A908F|nr:3-deoxy-D-manno-octulosonic acid transferase [Candidatus Paracaedibacter acanthamoebae]